MISVGIQGAAGYTGGELLRILHHHPKVNIVYASSRSQHGKPLSSIHADLFDLDLAFTDQGQSEVDCIFLCMGHGRGQTFMAEHDIPATKAIIDLSRDFRLQGSGSFIYGLPELHRSEIQATKRLANPGCFATCIQLALLPAANYHLLDDQVHVHAITGSTGAGQSPTPTTHFSWRNNNISIYKPFSHQHMDEIMQSVLHLHPNYQGAIHFIPMRGDFARGILASLHWTTSAPIEEILEKYQTYYQHHPFVHITADNPDLKQVVNTNYCFLHLKKYGDQLHIISIIDNLIKGASGQAVQNFNLMFGLKETQGLQLKSIVY